MHGRMQEFYGLTMPPRETLTGDSTWPREVFHAKINDMTVQSQEY